jgi:hypothetical protein
LTWPQPILANPRHLDVLTSVLSHPVRGWIHPEVGAVEQSVWLVTEPRHFEADNGAYVVIARVVVSLFCGNHLEMTAS